MTPGAFGAIALAFRLLLTPGDEVLIPLPGWFCYGSMLAAEGVKAVQVRSEEHTSELQSLMRISYAVFCLKKKNYQHITTDMHYTTFASDNTVKPSTTTDITTDSMYIIS